MLDEVILKRRSVRNFLNQPISNVDEEFIRQEVIKASALKGPFGHQFSFFYLENRDGRPNEARAIGLYGQVKNAQAFFGASVQNDFYALIDYGFLFEHLILSLTAHGIGTVWLGALFQRERLKDLLKEGEIIPAIAAFGYPAEHYHIRERFARYSLKADQRLPFDRLFSQDQWGSPLVEQHPLTPLLELVRVGPSATNQQPWRILVKGNFLHLYLKPTPNYAKEYGFEMQSLDMGVALYHLKAGLESMKKPFTFYQDPMQQSDSMKYILSAQVR